MCLAERVPFSFGRALLGPPISFCRISRRGNRRGGSPMGLAEKNQ
jgi:hypothetical protein